MEERGGSGRNRIWEEEVGRRAHAVGVADTSAVAERVASAEGAVGVAGIVDIAAVEAVVVVKSCCSKELEHDQRQSEDVAGAAVGRKTDSASAEVVIDRRAVVVVVAGRNRLGGMARSVAEAYA